MRVYIYKWQYNNNVIYGYGVYNDNNITLIVKDFIPSYDIIGIDHGYVSKKSLNCSNIVNVNTKIGNHSYSLLQFLFDNNLTQCCWIDLDVVENCNNIYNIISKDIKYIDDNTIPKLHIMSFDIETYSSNKAISDISIIEDCIICISVTSNRLDNITFFLNKDLSLDNITNIDNNIVICNSEKIMVDKFYKYIIDSKPNILSGHNIYGFDWRYILGRVPLEGDVVIDSWSSTALGNVNIVYLNIDSILTLDTYYYCKKTFKIDDYRLNTVSKYFNCGHKIDLPYIELWNLWDNIGNSDSDSYIYINRIVEYCVMDCLLIIDIITNSSMIDNLFSLSNITYTDHQSLLANGQQIRIKNMLYIECKINNYYLEFGNYTKERYTGAYVINCNIGIYDHVACMDFASLYPSIIISENICYSTFNGIDFDKDKFGIIPKMMIRLLNSRKLNRDNKPYSNALKICANSIYGVFGSSGVLCLTEAASMIARVGRDHLLKASSYINSMGYNVIYGDTDSCMYTNGKYMDDKEHEQLAKDVTLLFDKPVEMKYECKYNRFLSLGKKMYITLHYNNDISYKGVIAVRRDRCKFALELYTEITKRIMRGELFRDYCRHKINDITNLDKSYFLLRKTYRPPYKTDTYYLEIYNSNYGPLAKDEVIYVYVSTLGGKRLGNRLRPSISNDPIDYQWYLNNMVNSIDLVMYASNKVFRFNNNI